MDLFNYMQEQDNKTSAPLAERMKPRTIDDLMGQQHILGPGKLLRRMIQADKIQSIILYGPPGTGKTSVAKVIAESTHSEFETLNAVTSGVKDIREVIKKAQDARGMFGKNTILFIDEIHRFNKSQQDALLPYVENGTVTLIGATTENPFFEVNSALISRSTVFRLNALEPDDLMEILIKAINDTEKGVGMFMPQVTQAGLEYLSSQANGDARKALNALELAVLTTKPSGDGRILIDEHILSECSQKRQVQYDKDGDYHYDIVSAFIKSMRGSDPDATLHYLARMIYAGEDVKFIARRIIIAASEDVGLADSNALVVAKSAFDAVHIIGMPEARIILSHAALYVATAPKSNSAYVGINQALTDVENGLVGDVPSHLRDATSNKMKQRYNMQDKAEIKNYLYPHSYEGHYVEQQYLPDELKDRKYFSSSKMGSDKFDKEKL
ncbi:replication-associated recombination protein A [Acidaminobacter sp. JC074]|uniref:replication-associated recombination protein A n=1 Tax=Acidaminobacter sp. JC074 TaxID=2530199 RepID=UPI001F0EC0D1|nr:replication-associated recombination protein A [Acidaminobacter sp. JC074]MCH4888765.1 replication-associated recombination protein A [Acidaminobacter sp. JC074]